MPKCSEIFTQEAEAFIRDHWKSYTDFELSQFLERRLGIKATSDQIKGLRSRRKWTAEKAGGSKPGRNSFLKAEAQDLIAWFCPVMKDQELAGLLRETLGIERTPVQISRWRKTHHIRNGRDSRWQKGHPATSGSIKKGEHRSRATEFKKGDISYKALPVGTEVRVDKGRGYWKRKIAEPNKWQVRSRWVWEQSNGPLKKGDILIHIDGNPENDSLENLRLINNKVLGRVNSSGRFHGRRIVKDETEWNQACISIACLEQKLLEETE